MDINTIFIDMDTLIAEQIVKNTDDSYTIFLNSKLSKDRQLHAYRHALLHIENNDFDKTCADKIEHDAHRPD